MRLSTNDFGASVAVSRIPSGLASTTAWGALSACIAEDIAFIPFFTLGGSMNEFNNLQLSRIAVRYCARPAKMTLVGSLAYSPVRLAILGIGWIAHLQENVAAGGIGLAGEDRAGLA